MKRRTFLGYSGASMLLPYLAPGCSSKTTLPDSRHLVATPEKRADYLARLLKELCTDLGPHPIGSPEYDRAASIVRREMALALPEARLDTFTFERWVLHGEPEFLIGDMRLETFPAHGTSGTPEEGLKGVLRKIDDPDGIPYGVVDTASGELRAYVTMKDYEKAVPLPYYFFKKPVKSLPTFNIGKQDLPLIEQAVAKSTPVLVKAIVEFIPDTVTENAVGILPGESSEELVFLAHMDTVYNSPGANDNTASVIVMLMLAHAVSGVRPKKTLTFIATTGEEYNKLGAIDYVKRRVEEGTLQNIRYIVTFDSLTWGPDFRVNSQDKELLHLIETIDGELNLPGTPILSERDGFQLDAKPFRETGARAMYVNSTGYKNDGVWHRPDDTAGSVPVDCVEIGYQMFHEYIRRICEL